MQKHLTTAKNLLTKLNQGGTTTRDNLLIFPRPVDAPSARGKRIPLRRWSIAFQSKRRRLSSNSSIISGVCVAKTANRNAPSRPRPA